ncbi:tRNA pseudouridine(13) synthase TruD [Candidatus Bathyarchaeota archaeon]|nr:tRNA pseudouridine(13) synthase TruD [Candidatus Bathyarchaeota archaeon]
MPIPEVDRILGMHTYATETEGLGGVIKESADDFVVEEMLVDGSKASVTGAVPSRAIGSSAQKQRFLLCLMIKRNWDTFIATKNVAKALGIDQGRVQFAGIKDARAVTAQHITIENVPAEDAAKIDIKNVKVTPIGYIREMLSLFYLLGNNFTITATKVDAPESVVQERVQQTIQELNAIGGIPNYFGHQRFGTTRPVTHLVGRALSQGRFEDAAMLFLANPGPYEHPQSRQVRQQLQDAHDFKWAAENYPSQLRFERMMLMHLAEHPTDYVGAFRRLPEKLLALFVQAHQSYLFNRFLSERLKLGLPLNEAVVGDFVVGVERSGLPLTTMEKAVTDANLAQVNASVKAGKMRVALPIYGFRQRLSGGVMGEMEREVLNSESVNDGPVRLNELSRVGGKGGLRTALAPVKDFKLLSTADAKLQVSFMLFRGCYATILLREIIKPQNPATSGF